MDNLVRQQTIYSGSDEHYEYLCDPCNSANEQIEAQGFCTVCKEYLCRNCYKCHSRSAALKDHALLDKDRMPKKFVKYCDPCKTVGESNEAAGYCHTCDEYLCSNCFKSHARSIALKHHTLLEKDKMPLLRNKDLADICKPKDNPTNKTMHNFIKDINVKVNEDEMECFIMKMTMLTTDTLVVADFNNKSLKIVDLTANVVKDRLKLEAHPIGLSMICKDQVAVVLEKKCKIQIVSVSQRLLVIKTLDTKDECVDVTSFKGQLLVSFCDPVKFKIIKQTGETSETINPDAEVLRYCKLPENIAVSADGAIIYISDWKTNKVLCMDQNGKFISKFDGGVDLPCGIIISTSGFVFLCNRMQNALYKMTSDLSEVTTILGRAEGLMMPNAICLNPEKKWLLISSGYSSPGFCNYIKIYELLQ